MGSPVWATSFPGSANELIYELDVRPDGTIAVGGRFDDTLTLGASNYSGGGSVVAVFDEAGSPVWSRALVGQVLLASVTTCPNGDVIAAGGLSGLVDFDGGSLTGSAPLDAFVVRYTAAGGYVDGHVFGAVGALEAVAAVTCDKDNSLYVTGNFSSAMSFGNDDLTSSGDADVFLAKYDAAHTPVWGKGFAAVGSQTGTAMTTDGAGNVVVSGTFTNTVDFGGGSLQPGTGITQFLAKLDTDGNHIWSRRVADAPDIFSADIAIDASLNIYVTGQVDGPAAFDDRVLDGEGGNDAWVAKFDSVGEYIWARRFGNFNDQAANSLVVSPDGFVVVGGGYTGVIQPGSSSIASAGGEDGFLVAYSAAGDHVWSFGIGSAGPEQSVTALGMRDDGDIIVAGEFDGLMSVGNLPLASSSQKDVFLARIAR